MKKKILLGIVFSAVLFFSSGFVWAQRSGNAQSPSVVLQNLDGSSLAVGDLKGRVNVLAIGATWLPLSKQQAEIINILQSKYGKKNVGLYFISTDSADAKSKNYADNGKIKTFGERNKLASTAILRDASGGILKLYNLDQIPAFVILNKDGEVVATVTGLDAEGGVDEAAANIAAELDKML